MKLKSIRSLGAGTVASSPRDIGAPLNPHARAIIFWEVWWRREEPWGERERGRERRLIPFLLFFKWKGEGNLSCSWPRDMELFHFEIEKSAFSLCPWPERPWAPEWAWRHSKGIASSGCICDLLLCCYRVCALSSTYICGYKTLFFARQTRLKRFELKKIFQNKTIIFAAQRKIGKRTKRSKGKK